MALGQFVVHTALSLVSGISDETSEGGYRELFVTPVESDQYPGRA